MKRVGRPPGGYNGEQVRNYPQTSVRLPQEVVNKIWALKFMTGKPGWKIIVEVIEHRIKTLRPDEKNWLIKSSQGG